MITVREIERIARLANLTFEAGELERFAEQFAQILDYVAQLDGLDVSGVEPTFHALPEAGRITAVRPDAVRPSFETELALSNAPDRDNDLFKVPRVIE